MNLPITGDPFPNGKCPPNCKCEEKYWHDCCESLESVVEEYENKVRGQKILPLPCRPTKEQLSRIASRTYWLEFGEAMCSSVDELSFDIGFPECMASFHDNIESILAHLDELELEELSAQYDLPIDQDDSEDEDAIDMTGYMWVGK
jgi:hypothetical protein